MTKPTLYVLVGLPASGKSTYAEELLKNNANIKLISSDNIRAELYTVDDQEHNGEVFELAHNRTKEYLSESYDVIFDATNITKKARAGCLKSASGIDCKKVCVVIATPFKKCIENNNKRERHVPEHVLEHMRKAFWVPVKGEGFDDILIHYPIIQSADTQNDFITRYLYFDQENPHHTLSLGLHCHLAQQRADYSGLDKNNKKILETACALHDCGKPLTKEWNFAKGYYSYFSHHNVGAYESLFYQSIDPVKVAILINYHMCPYMEWKDSKKCLAKDRVILGDELYDLIMRLHVADLSAH